MDVYKKQRLKGIVMAAVFVLAIYMQFLGHSIRGYKGLILQLLSLLTFITLLYIYNRKFR